ncbi:hypothetical protein DEU56DRAFT_423947 [Suillus clintonianus]|uniref:uncharacterized protein n=1 Tax=Suillus clintonianus TaxID=1904413 RepID=UPI001B85EFD1|nr:uncharacterized protein DEU56DRAFT_423947 [Suillus clintonianus]KAG2133015.1 hypothetical protein DEU56DRAFT_423947 [Suillus clintonianus]
MAGNQFENALERLSMKVIVAVTEDIELPLTRNSKRKRSALLDTVRDSEAARQLIIAAGKKKTPDVVETSNPSELHHALQQLTVKEYLTTAGGGKFSRVNKRRRSTLIEAVERSPELQKLMISAAAAKEERVHEDRERALKRVCLQQEPQSTDDDHFLEEVEKSVHEKCLSNFIDRTENDATRQAVCITCAGEYFASEATEIALRDIHNKNVLRPFQVHPHQKLLDDMLLYHQAVFNKGEDPYGYICGSCLDNINVNKTPMLSLANNLWVREIPNELAMLVS